MNTTYNNEQNYFAKFCYSFTEKNYKNQSDFFFLIHKFEMKKEKGNARTGRMKPLELFWKY